MQHHLLIKNALLSPLTGQCLQVASRRWRPLVAAALGLFSIAGGASAQNRALPLPQAVERVVRPLVGAPAAAPLARAVAAHKALAAIGSTATGGN